MYRGGDKTMCTAQIGKKCPNGLLVGDRRCLNVTSLALVYCLT